MLRAHLPSSLRWRRLWVLGRYSYRPLFIFRQVKSRPQVCAGLRHFPKKYLVLVIEFFIRPWVLVICVRWSRTIIFKQRPLIPVICLPPGHPLHPVQAYKHYLRSALQPGSILPASLPRVLWRRHQTQRTPNLVGVYTVFSLVLV